MPKKSGRAMTQILSEAGNMADMIPMPDGQRILTKKEIIARAVWQAITEGRVILPVSGVTMTIGARDWLDMVKWVYNHIDGPARIENELTDEELVDVAETITEEQRDQMLIALLSKYQK